MNRLRAISLAIVFSIVAFASQAAAQAVPGEVLIVLAKETAGTRAPELANIAALSRPPFDAFPTMSILSRPSVTFQIGQPSEVNLPNGRKLRVVVERRLPNGRFMARISINRPNENDYLPLLTVVASPGDYVFVAGQSYQDGTLVIGIRIGAPAAP